MRCLAHTSSDIATFYTMFHREPVGKKVLLMCLNVSCMLTGAWTLRKLGARLGIKAGQTSADGEFTLIEEECLAACADGPAMMRRPQLAASDCRQGGCGARCVSQAAGCMVTTPSLHSDKKH